MVALDTFRPTGDLLSAAVIHVAGCSQSVRTRSLAAFPVQPRVGQNEEIEAYRVDSYSQLGTGILDHLGPLPGFLSHQPPKIGG